MKLRTKTIRIASARKEPFLIKNKKLIGSSLKLINAITNITKTIIDRTKKFIGLV
jgi:hypothetical protein